MEKYWNWEGNYIGVRQKDYLTACDGIILGKFYGKEIYDQNGNYIGEIGKNNRLIKNKTKENFRRPGFSFYVKGTITAPFKSCDPYPMIPGYEDFLR
ncbi:hypothetical protein [Lacrimispora sp.]|uniref:hypothetical protein n=1 Tax=Lacrimispora sp. TaxID=2719234 RepID=UPI002FDB95F1